jgi:hypothetical protein
MSRTQDGWQQAREWLPGHAQRREQPGCVRLRVGDERRLRTLSGLWSTVVFRSRYTRPE